MKEKIDIPQNIPLAILLKDGRKTFSKEVQDLTEGTAFKAIEIVSLIKGKDQSYFKEFDEIKDYLDNEIDLILYSNISKKTIEKKE